MTATSAGLIVKIRRVLRRADQTAVAGLVVLALVALAASWVLHGGLRGGLVEIDRAVRRQVRFRVDVNRASWPELAQLPGIGPTLARRIVACRTRRGPFRQHDDLLMVRGIGPSTLARATSTLLVAMPQRRSGCPSGAVRQRRSALTTYRVAGSERSDGPEADIQGTAAF